MKRFLVLSLIVSFSMISCGKGDSPEAQYEKLANAGKAMCEKVFDCTAEMMKDMPEAQKQQALQMMGGKEKCSEAYQKTINESKEKTEKGELEKITKEEIELALQCMDDIAKTSCQSLMSEDGQPASCKKLAESESNRK